MADKSDKTAAVPARSEDQDPETTPTLEEIARIAASKPDYQAMKRLPVNTQAAVMALINYQARGTIEPSRVDLLRTLGKTCPKCKKHGGEELFNWRYHPVTGKITGYQSRCITCHGAKDSRPKRHGGVSRQTMPKPYPEAVRRAMTKSQQAAYATLLEDILFTMKRREHS